MASNGALLSMFDSLLQALESPLWTASDVGATVSRYVADLGPQPGAQKTMGDALNVLAVRAPFGSLLTQQALHYAFSLFQGNRPSRGLS